MRGVLYICTVFCMRFRLFRLREKGGLIPKWQRATHRGELGVLRVSDVRDDVLNRATRQADLLDVMTGAPVPGVLPLRDVQLVHWSGGTLVLNGIERDDDVLLSRPVDYAQSWWLEFEGEEQG